MAVLLSSFSPSRASRAIATGAATTSFTPQDPQSWATGASTTSFAATCAATASSSPQDPRLRIYRSRSPSQALRCPISVTISFAGPSQGEERQDDSEDEIADEDAEGMEYEEEAGDGIFQVTVADPDGNQKPFHLMNGPIYVPEEIRGTLYKTVFTDMHAVGEADMTEIVWEMYKDASNDVDSIDELQYIVHKVDAVDAKSKRLALPENLVHGYNYPRELQGFLPGS
ncbi:hypothetical protein ACQ4PT_066627 [Festuca glaucescens]